MPIKLNWFRGKNLGLAFIFLAAVGYLQVIFIIIAQYGFKVGNMYYIWLIPIGVTLALFYGVIIIFESQTSMSKYREARPFMLKKGSIKFTQSKEWMILKPILLIIIAFAAFYWLAYAIAFKPLENENETIFIICENAGAIGGLITASVIETMFSKKTR